MLLAVLGFAFVVQVRDTKANDTYAGLRESELIEVLDGLTGTAERARREVGRLEARRDELPTRAGAAARRRSTRPSNGSRTLNIIAGLVPVTGPGLRITINESTSRVTVGSLLDTVQELRTAGAEAMEFNDSIRLGARQLLRQRRRRHRARRPAPRAALRPRRDRRPARAAAPR